MQTSRRSAVVVLAVEIRRFYDQRVPFPMAACVADPGLDVIVQFRPSVEWYDPRLMNQLVDDHRVTRRLHDLNVVVVQRREARARQTIRDAAFLVAAVEP